MIFTVDQYQRLYDLAKLVNNQYEFLDYYATSLKVYAEDNRYYFGTHAESLVSACDELLKKVNEASSSVKNVAKRIELLGMKYETIYFNDPFSDIGSGSSGSSDHGSKGIGQKVLRNTPNEENKKVR